jgi:hypothetical protein
MAENPIKYSDLFQDDGAIDKLISKLGELEGVYKKLNNTIQKQIKETKTEAAGVDIVDEESIKRITELENKLAILTKQYDKLRKSEDEYQKTKKETKDILTEEEKLQKKRNALLQEDAVKLEALKLEITEITKANKKQAKEALGLVGAYDKLSGELNDLRKAYKNLAAEGQANSEEAEKLLFSITKLDTELKEIDATVGQTQRSVGNYKEAVKEALEETDLWGEGLTGMIDKSGVLGGVLQKLQLILGLLKKQQQANTAASQVNTVATEANATATSQAATTQNLFARAQLGAARASRVLGKALKASGIGLVIAALAGLVAMLTKTQAGVDNVAVGIEGIKQVLEVLIGRFAKFGSSILSLFKGIGQGAKGIALALTGSFSDAGKAFDEAGKSFAASWDNAKASVTGLKDEVSAAIEVAKEIAAFEKERRKNAILLKKQIAELNAEAEKGEEIEGDNTKSFEERKQAILSAAKAQKEASKLSVQLIEDEIKALELRAETARRAGTFEANIEAQEEIAEKQVELIEAQTEATVKGLALRRIANQLEQDLIEKNLDILIDGFDNQKTINEQLIADEKRSFEERKRILEETKALQTISLNEEIKEIEKKAKKQIDIQDLIATSDAKLLNDKIRGLGLSEILEGRLLEVIRDNRTATNDLKTADKDLNESRISFLNQVIEKTKQLQVQNEGNVTAQRELEENYRYEKEIEELELQIKVAENDLELTTALLDKKAQLEIEHNRKLADNKITTLQETNQIEEKQLEIKLLKEGEKEKEITEQLRDFKIKALEEEIKTKQDLQRDALNEELELARLKSEKEREITAKRLKDQQELTDLVANASFDAFKERIDKENALLDDQTQKQEDKVTLQQQRAAEGLENTLAFEEAELAKLEQKKLQQERRAIRLEKVKALYSAYSAAASAGDNNAIVKVIRDFALIQGIENSLSSFGEGTGEHGTVAEALSSKRSGSKGGNSIYGGLIRGESHKRRGFGVPILVEGGEGILSVNQMKAFGVDNFQQLTKSLDSGIVGTNVFSGQIGQVPVLNTVNIDLSSLKKELRSVKQAIESKPVQQVNVEQLSKSYTDFVDTRIEGNRKVISRFRVNKKRI